MGSMACAAFSFMSSSSHSSLMCRCSNRITSKLPQASCSETSIISTTTVMPCSSGNVHILATKSHSSVLAAEESFSYKTQAISMQPKVIVEATIGEAMLLKIEELDTESASAEARNAARDVAVIWEDIQNLPKAKLLSNGDLQRSEREKLTQIEVLGLVKLFKESKHAERNSGAQCSLNGASSFTYHPQLERESSVLSKFEANSIQVSQNVVEKTTRSKKKLRTRIMKAGLLEKTTAVRPKSVSVLSTKKSKMITVPSVDPSYMHHDMVSRIFLADNEAEFCQGLKDLRKLEKIRARVKIKVGHEPTPAQWAEAVGLDQGTLYRKLLAGQYCKDKIVKGAIRLVISVAKMYEGKGVSLPDLIQEGCLGLLRGAEKFDYKKGFKFSTYVYWWIRQAVTDAITKNSRTIRLPGYLIDTLLKIRKTKISLYRKFRRPPKDEEIASYLNLSVSRIRFVKKCSKFPRSIDRHISQNYDSRLGEFIADPEVKSSEIAVTRQKVRQDIDELLETLRPREKEVVRLRFGLDGGISRTRKEVAHHFCVSKERIRQIENNALGKLRHLNRHKDIKCYLGY
ncbi:hypothetical protein SUGI_0952860 [Cryptomeria japonica]|uniref:uncharacterized protein LOC131060954 n=1 Tax=Cryptomeria japonica TaxID=3369 RepID=UPI002414C1DA|nr:uncharacterized protein LOC131060954 [Cryptomeria japonica]GLJ45271.1 hypothetical protein SUGI_0952860 [Cryptomeria japonica]